jgi:hypothetical protein
MVGLPARGKSYISRRLSQYIAFFYGAPTKVFNVGDYRRKEAAGAFQSADFFDESNAEAVAVRRRASKDALEDLRQWMAHVTPNRLDSDLYLSGDVRKRAPPRSEQPRRAPRRAVARAVAHASPR